MVKLKLNRRKLLGAFQLMVAFGFTITIIASYMSIQYDGVALLEKHNYKISRTITSITSLSAEPFINTANREKLASIANLLIKQPYIIDATFYDHFGAPLAQSDGILPLNQIIPLADSTQDNSSDFIPYVNAITDSNGDRIGYLRLTFKSQSLVDSVKNYALDTSYRLLIMVGMAIILGFILARRSWKKTQIIRLLLLQQFRDFIKSKSLKSSRSSH